MPKSIGVTAGSRGRRLIGFAQRVLNAPLGYPVLAVDALGVDLEQYGDAVPGPLGDLGGRDAAVEPGGDARMVGFPDVAQELLLGLAEEVLSGRTRNPSSVRLHLDREGRD